MSYSISLIKKDKFVSEELDSNSKFILIKHFPFQEWASKQLEEFASSYGSEMGKAELLTKELLNKILNDERIKRNEDPFRTTKSDLLALRVECNWFNRLFYNYYIYVG